MVLCWGFGKGWDFSAILCGLDKHGHSCVPSCSWPSLSFICPLSTLFCGLVLLTFLPLCLQLDINLPGHGRVLLQTWAFSARCSASLVIQLCMFKLYSSGWSGAGPSLTHFASVPPMCFLAGHPTTISCALPHAGDWARTDPAPIYFMRFPHCWCWFVLWRSA